MTIPSFRQFLNEEHDDLERFASHLETKHGAKVHLGHHHNGAIHLYHLEVPKEKRKTGIGSAIMTDINKYADEHGKRVTLNPAHKDDKFGTTSRNRLIKFYKDHGYIQNKGRHKDFRTNAGMYRNPETRRDLKETVYKSPRERALALGSYLVKRYAREAPHMAPGKFEIGKYGRHYDDPEDERHDDEAFSQSWTYAHNRFRKRKPNIVDMPVRDLLKHNVQVVDFDPKYASDHKDKDDRPINVARSRRTGRDDVIDGFHRLATGAFNTRLPMAYSWEGIGNWIGSEIHHPINSVVDLADAIRSGLRDTTMVKEYIKDGLREIDEQHGWEKLIHAAIERIHRVYKSEGEWLVNQPYLVIPPGSTIIVGTKPDLGQEPHPVFGLNYDREQHANYKRWLENVDKLRKRYVIRLVPESKFDEYRKNINHY